MKFCTSIPASVWDLINAYPGSLKDPLDAQASLPGIRRVDEATFRRIVLDEDAATRVDPTIGSLDADIEPAYGQPAEIAADLPLGRVREPQNSAVRRDDDITPRTRRPV